MNLPALDRQSVVPLYYQIQQHLLGGIRSGKLKPGAPIPSEQEISVRLRISRMTARQALKSLCDLGVTYSQTGKGTFVSGIKLEKNEATGHHIYYVRVRVQLGKPAPHDGVFERGLRERRTDLRQGECFQFCNVSPAG